MQRIWKLLLFMMVSLWILAACGGEGAETETAVSNPPTLPPEIIATALPDTPIPVEESVGEPEPIVVEPVESVEVEPEPVVVEPVESIETEPVQAVDQPLGRELNGYTNVIYTEANGDLVGNTNRLQLLNVYASW